MSDVVIKFTPNLTTVKNLEERTVVKFPTSLPGPPGADGENGVGIPMGGTAGQVFVKNSSADYDGTWVDFSVLFSAYLATLTPFDSDESSGLPVDGIYKTADNYTGGMGGFIKQVT
jgi:hypothetical protein